MEKRAIIIWHYYENGVLVDYATSRFTGNDAQLDDCIKNDESGKRKNNGKKKGERICILHQLIILE